jgi:predicted ATP-dependent protease
MNVASFLHPLEPARLVRRSDISRLNFLTTAELPSLDESVGQERAMDAISFGTEINHAGYNLYVMGSSGMGRHHLLKQKLIEQASKDPPRSDWCYVANYMDPSKPRALRLPAGMGRQLSHHMDQLIGDLLNAIPTAFQSDEYRRRFQEITQRFKQRKETTAATLSSLAEKHSVALLDTPTGYSITAMRDNKILSSEEFEALPEEEKARYHAAIDKIKKELRDVLAKVPLWQKELRQYMEALESDITELTASQLIKELKASYEELPEVLEYLQQVQQDIVENGRMFRSDDEIEQEQLSADNPRFTRYRVNLLVEQQQQHAPVIYEDNPTYQNLVGRIEHIARMGTLITDFTLIKPGALHLANGGYLVLDAQKILSSAFAWDGLKRALSAKEVRIDPIERQLSLAGTVSLEPEPIKIDLKVAIVGDRFLYFLLKAYDPEFSSLFKVTADFEEDMHRDDSRDETYAQLIATLQQREGLRALDPSGVSQTIDWASRRTGDSEKLSLHMGSLLNLLQEADHLAQNAELAVIDGTLINQAIGNQRHRLDRIRERLQEDIQRGTLLIDTQGAQLAQVNGLSILEVAGYAFGIPTRISATARIGSGDLIDIERETTLGGPLHSKGVLIISAYLAYRYARHQPLSLSASLVFEQTYGEVEGDSASAAELCALLSAIGDVPLNQSLAVTGSVNQHGQIQAIGGVNEKIEGFFDICNGRGLSGKQGVIIPAANVKDLMLNEQLVEAAAAGKFHIYAASHIDQVMTLLTGIEAGQPDAEGLYGENTVNGHIQMQLFQWTALRQQYAGVSGRSAD